MLPVARLALAFLFTWSALSLVKAGVFKWMQYDNFDEIMDKFSAVTADNCRSKPREELQFSRDTVAQIPRYNMLLSTIIYANRSSLLHLHNMALNRAFFYSFIYQKLNKTEDFFSQPGLMYLYMSAGADVSANPGFLNGSAIYYDNNCNYANWYTTLDFNKTLPLFGPRAWRADDYNEPTNILREPTNNTIDIQDYAAGRQSNYTNPAYKTNQWYKLWDMPDISSAEDSLRKYTYSVGIKYSNMTGYFTDDEFETTAFFGPPQPSQSERVSLPVLFSTPYFDCGRSNKWIVSATAPVVEFMSRYSPWLHLRRPRFVAIVSEDIEFERIDINPCPISEGNPAPNYFAGTDRCKHNTTMCEPLHGHGFRRGGYICVCRPGHRYPWWHNGPWLGMEIEQASEDEYRDGFDCFNVDWRIVTPVNDPTYVTKRSVRTPFLDKKSRFIRSLSPALEINHRFPRPVVRSKRNLKRAHLVAKRMIAEQVWERNNARLVAKVKKEEHSRQKRNTYDQGSYNVLRSILQKVATTTGATCGSMKPSDLLLPGDVSYGVETQFETQGRVALRLSHFLSDFMQNVGDYEEFGIIKGDRRLNETHIFGETLANVMSDFKIRASGVFFDRYKFRMSPPLNNTDPRFITGVTRELFGPFAWRSTGPNEGLDEFRALDYAGFKDSYVNERWFRDMKSRWATNIHGLKTFTSRPMIRSDISGTSSIRFEHFPIKYKAPLYESGEWLRPRFKCDGRVNKWVITYVAPFFGLDSIRSQIEFKGVVSVDVDLQELSINQCPASFSVPNAFKNTAQCDYDSTYCVPLPGKKFNRGFFKCECKPGYEYPFNDLAWYYDGQTMEEEYSKYAQGLPSRFTTLKCRISGAGRLGLSWLLVGALTTLLFLLH